VGTGEKAKNFKPNFKRLMGRFRPERVLLALVVSLAVVGVAAQVGAPQILKRATNDIFAGAMSRQINAGVQEMGLPADGWTKEQVVAQLEAAGQTDHWEINSALDALATGRVNQADRARYESLPMNGSLLVHTLVRNATILTGTGVAPFRGDVGIGISRTVGRDASGPLVRHAFRIEDLGDLRVLGALETIDATGLTLAPLLDRELKIGDLLSLPDGPVAPGIAPVAVGSPADLVLLEPAAEPGRFRVVRVLRSERVIK
jgi:hypothetical protein